jgi:2'-5' RNA ligase
MKRYRIGLIHQFSESHSRQVDGLRSALGGFGIGRVPPHITLVPPTNLHPREIDAEIYRLRVLASETAPYVVEVGPAGTFLPVSSVLYLSVLGGGVEQLAALQKRLVSSKLYKANSRPFVPHVTLLEPVDQRDAEAALQVMKAPLFEHRATSFEMMVSPSQGYWEVSSDFRFGPSRKRYRGGIQLKLFCHASGDVAIYAFVSQHEISQSLFWPYPDRRLRTDGQSNLVVSLYSEGKLVACASAVRHSTIALIRAVVVRGDAQRLGLGALAVDELLYQLQLGGVEEAFVICCEAHEGFFRKCGAVPATVGRWLIDYDSGMTLNSWSFSSL